MINDIYTTTSKPYYLSFDTSTIPISQIVTGSYTTNTESIIITESVIQKEEKELSPIEKKIKEQIKINKKEYGFVDIKEYVPNKVYEFSIFDGFKTEKIKTICDEEDEFNLEIAFFLALTKKLHSDFTPEGHLHKAKELAYSKYYTKIVKHGMKLFKLLKEKEAYDKAEEERLKIKHQKYVAKKKARNEKRKQEANLELYKIIKDAIEDAK